VVTESGKRLGVFECEEHAANLTFGGPAWSTLYLTAATSVYSVETTVRGIAPGSARPAARTTTRGTARPITRGR
jgi:gluconolactonase